MKPSELRNLSNNFQDVRLVSLHTWPAARTIEPRDPGGPYIVAQEGYDPKDPAQKADEFVLGRSGCWVSTSIFFKMSVEDRRAEFIFGTAAEVMMVMAGLPTAAAVLRPGQPAAPVGADVEEFNTAFLTARNRGNSASK